MSQFLSKRVNYNQLTQFNPTYTDRFLFPILKLNYALLKQEGLLFSFNGDEERPDKIKKEIVLVFHKKPSQQVDDLLRKHPKFDGTSWTKNIYKYYYRLNKDEIYTIVNKMWRGLYSEFPESHKSLFVPLINVNGHVSESVNYQIIHKSIDRRQKLEKDLNCKLPANAELLSKPEEYKEIFGYKYVPSEADILLNEKLEEIESYLALITNIIY